MKDIRCDVLVVGAGPAGSSLAALLAGEGIDTVLAERKSRPGVPTRCAEFVPKAFAGLYDKRLDPVLRKIVSMRTYIEDELVSELGSPGFIIDRKSLIRKNIKRFKEGSGRYLGSTKVLEITGDRKARMKAAALKGDKTFYIHPEIAVGAGGITSPVSKSMGRRRLQRYILGINQQIELRPSFDDDSTRVFFSRKICQGYGWIFPRYETANFGMGLSTTFKKGDGRQYKEILKDFAKGILGPDYRPVSPAVAGLIPVGGLTEKVVDGKKIIIGDEAGLCDPVTGAGIYNAVLSANIAAGPISEALKTDDMEKLSAVEDRFTKEFFPHLKRALEKRQYLGKNWETEDLTSLIRKSWPAFKGYWS